VKREAALARGTAKRVLAAEAALARRRHGIGGARLTHDRVMA